MNGLSKAALLAAVSLPGLIAAQQPQSRPQQPQFSYTYVEIGYDESDFDLRGPGEVDGDGLTVSGSFEITDEWHAFASFGSANLDFGIDLDAWAIGAGYVFPLKEDVDLYGRVLYIDWDFNVPTPVRGDDDGLGLQFRIRGRVNNQVELEGGVQYMDVGDADLSLQAFARYHFSETFSAGVGLTFGGDVEGIGINARFSF
jgi:hypothetical protein